jgi:hypothetical protein
MRNRSWFKSEAGWTVAVHYLIPALGALALLAATVAGWLRARG